jgi:chromosome segregation ATPase
MVFVLGFLSAALLSLVLMGAVWKRAVRLTTRRVENSVPMSMAEIKADKDQLRAEHAVVARRLEVRADTLAEKVNGQAIELAQGHETIRDLRTEIAGLAERIGSLESVRAELEESQAKLRADLADRETDIRVGGEVLRQKEQEFAALDHELAGQKIDNDSLRVESVALRTQIDNLKSMTAQLSRELDESQRDLAGHRLSFAETSTLLSDERRRAAGLSGDIERLEERLTTETVTVGELRTEIAELNARLAEEAERASREQASRDAAEKSTAKREAERDKARTELAKLKEQAAETQRSLLAEVETLRADKGLAEGALAHAREERDAIQREIAALKRTAASTDTRDAKEQLKLRQRIDDVALDVAKVAMLLDEPGSRIDAILADYAQQSAAGGKPRRKADLTLADRILALRAEAEREDSAAARGHAAE